MADTAVSVVFFDGRAQSYSLRPQDTVSELRSRVGLRMGLPSSAVRLACGGVVLSDGRASVSATVGESTVTAWACRSARSRSDDAVRQSRARAAVRVWSPWLITAARALADITWRAPLMAWVQLFTWALLFFGAKYVGLTGPFLILSAMHAVYMFGFQERAPGEESAYTVFNNMRALPGQLRAEDLQRDLVRGM